VYYLPNRAYYPHVDSMTVAHLHSTLSNLFLYAFMELVSLLLLHTILKRRFRLPGVAQLAFVLEKQWGGVQMKFLFFVLYNAQPPLQHFGKRVQNATCIPWSLTIAVVLGTGFDYTFQFAWLHQPQNSTISS